MKSTTLKKKSSIPIKKYAGLFVALFVVGLLFFFEHFNESPFTIQDINTPQPNEDKFDQEKSRPGFIAPKFTLRNLKGNLDSLDNYKGQVIVLNFWATWCAPCLVEMPSFEALYRRYRSQGLTVLAVSIDKGNNGKVQKFVEERGLSFPVLLDEKGEAEKLYPSVSIPFTYVIDQYGRVVTRVDGAKNWQSKETFEAVEYLLNGTSKN